MFQPPDRSEFYIESEDLVDGVGLYPVSHQSSVIGIVSQGHRPTHPHALLLGGRDLVADTLGRDLTFELGKGEQHVQRQAPHRVGGVELLGDGDEGDTAGFLVLVDRLSRRWGGRRLPLTP